MYKKNQKTVEGGGGAVVVEMNKRREKASKKRSWGIEVYCPSERERAKRHEKSKSGGREKGDNALEGKMRESERGNSRRIRAGVNSSCKGE